MGGGAVRVFGFFPPKSKPNRVIHIMNQTRPTKVLEISSGAGSVSDPVRLIRFNLSALILEEPRIMVFPNKSPKSS